MVLSGLIKGCRDFLPYVTCWCEAFQISSELWWKVIAWWSINNLLEISVVLWGLFPAKKKKKSDQIINYHHNQHCLQPLLTALHRAEDWMCLENKLLSHSYKQFLPHPGKGTLAGQCKESSAVIAYTCSVEKKVSCVFKTYLRTLFIRSKGVNKSLKPRFEVVKQSTSLLKGPG